jgi:hypothetical protein
MGAQWVPDLCSNVLMQTARFRARRLATWLLAGALFVTAFDAAAENAADKATARKLATEGIELYQAGKYPEALDRLERAEALFDAPVHLLYIARTQSALNRWVEAAETYRKLVRVKLDAGAPEAFQQAIDDGKKELAELEPKIPSLKVEVTPLVSGLEVRIDGEVVSSAALGVDRPINPGEHQISATAPGYVTKERPVTVAPGSSESVLLELPQKTGGQAPNAKAREIDAAEPKKSPKKLGLFVGVRLFAAIPAGTAGSADLGVGETKVSMSDVMGAGGGLELQGGLTFARYFAGKIYLDLYNMTPGDLTEDNARISGVDVGLGLHAGTEPHRFGGFGEIGIGFLHDFEWHDESDTLNVTRDITLKGAPSLRIGGGAIIPVGKYFHVTPFMLASFAQFTKTRRQIDSASPSIQDSDVTSDIPEDNRGGHQLFLLGLGGDWLIGG